MFYDPSPFFISPTYLHTTRVDRIARGTYVLQIEHKEHMYLTRIERRLGRMVTTEEAHTLLEQYNAPLPRREPLFVKCIDCNRWINTTQIIVRPVLHTVCWACDNCVPF